MFAVKVYGITAAGGDPERRNLQQKVMLANSVAQSFMSADNANSRGQRMFLLRRQKSEKWTTSGPDPPADVAHHQQQRDDGATWPQKAPAGRQPPYAQPPPAARQQSVPQHYLPSGPTPARSTSVEGMIPSQHRQVQLLPRVAAPGPQQHGFLKRQAAPQHVTGQFPPGPRPQQQGFLRPARPPGPLPGQERTGLPVQQARNRSESFGSLPADVRSTSGDRQSSMFQPQQQRDRHFSGEQQYPQQARHWPASSPSSSQPYMLHSHYGVSDL